MMHILDVIKELLVTLAGLAIAAATVHKEIRESRDKQPKADAE